MADFKILEKSGRFELADVGEAIQSRALDIDQLWRAVGYGDMEKAAGLLLEAWYDLGRGVGASDVESVTMISIPDDIVGRRYRIWVTVRPKGKR